MEKISNMENKINIAEILKDCPKGMELDCTIYNGKVYFDGFDHDNTAYPIKISINSEFIEHLNIYGQYNTRDYAKCVIFPKGKTTWEGFQRPFKDGDIVFSGASLISIFKGISEGYRESLHSYVSVVDGIGFKIDKDYWTLENIRLATEEERQILFQAIKDNGYRWNEETKTLDKLIEPKFNVGDRIKSKELNLGISTITKVCENYYELDDGCTVKLDCQDGWELVPNKFDISTLKPFDKVLVRDNNSQVWRISFFSHYNNLLVLQYSCINGYGYMQCIPYEGNEHLLGKTDDCDEYFKTWE